MTTIILVNPQMGENIGAAARVMKNFGMTDLRLVAPRDGWPNQKAVDMAAGGADIVHAAQVFETTADAIADCQLVYATTNRDRYMSKDVVTPRELFVSPVTSLRTAILFGPERTGLTNEDVALSDAILTIPVNPEYPSLNLAQAVALVAYEWFQKLEWEKKRGQEAESFSRQQGVRPIAEERGQNMNLATKADLHGLFNQLEAALDAGNFWKAVEKKPIMWRNIRSTLQRARLTVQEVQTVRGIIRCLTERGERRGTRNE